MDTLLAHPKFRLDFSSLKRNTAMKTEENSFHDGEVLVEQNQIIEHLRQVKANYCLERKTFW
ncbi:MULTISPECIES: hypothetical protein [unclassified Nostoc]|uniref:hypothetical protein n=1 Tax=unclassified Nostoc TaxID=2593658 RepID=UPI001682A051|nr:MULTISPECIES: hypothetical protein [unclassified Nostoc]MBD2472710.1 hypothetical protein [Nostoc sp. FACHB-145]